MLRSHIARIAGRLGLCVDRVGEEPPGCTLWDLALCASSHRCETGGEGIFTAHPPPMDNTARELGFGDTGDVECRFMRLVEAREFGPQCLACNVLQLSPSSSLLCQASWSEAWRPSEGEQRSDVLRQWYETSWAGLAPRLRTASAEDFSDGAVFAWLVSVFRPLVEGWKMLQ